MNLEKYPVCVDKDFIEYKFISEGPKGRVEKLVLYEKLGDGIYNIGFGDLDYSTGKVDDYAVTNNNDSTKVLSTVASTLYLFSEKFPGAIIYAGGTTLSRTRLYRMGINKYLELLKIDFQIFGYIDNNWQFFEKNIPYLAFYAIKKFNFII